MAACHVPACILGVRASKAVGHILAHAHHMAACRILASSCIRHAHPSKAVGHVPAHVHTAASRASLHEDMLHNHDNHHASPDVALLQIPLHDNPAVQMNF